MNRKTDFSADVEPHIQALMLAEQVRIVYRSLVPILIANMIVSASLIVALWGHIASTLLVVWFGFMFVATSVRLAGYFIYKKYFKVETAKRYGLYFVIGAGISGILWGSSGFLLFASNDITLQYLLVMMLLGVAAVAVATKNAYLPGLFAFLPISLLPLVVNLFIHGGRIHLAIGLGIISYILSVSYYAINANRSLKETFMLRFENQELVEQLRLQKDEAERANIAKSKFLAAASHDLRQPLHALSLFTSVLYESIQYPRVRKVVDQISASVQALQSLFDALLDVSRLDAGIMKPEKSHFYLQVIIEKLKNDFNPQAEEKGLSVFWPDTNAVVCTDITLLEQILRNYVSNAVRYTPAGSIHTSCDVEGDQLLIRIRDTGIGIPEHELESIFGEFHQLSNPERDRSKGLGLGLAIVHRTAKLLEHDIAVESSPGKGSTFSIAVDQGDERKIMVNQTPNHDHAEYTNHHTLMMVVDDETSAREATRSLLELWGCEVLTAVDQEEALVLLHQAGRGPDGIIADYRLREDRTGIEAIHAIHSHHHADIPALIVTGDISADRLKEASNSGFQMLHKPVEAVKLRAFVRNVQSHRV